MTLKERIKKLANAEGLSLPKLEEELGFGGGTISRWDKSAPSADKLSKIADRYNVTVDYLLGRELSDKDKKDISKDLENIMLKLSSGEDGPASFNGEELSPDASELFREELEIALKRLKIVNKEKYTPKKYKE